jgi:hypothetical protein
VRAVSKHVLGRVEEGFREDAESPECGTTGLRQAVHLEITANIEAGGGSLTLDQIGREGCDEIACDVFTTHSRLEVTLRGVRELEGRSALADGTFTVDDFVEILSSQGGRGEHAGTFTYLTEDGVRVRGAMLGISQAGTHRAPSSSSCEPAMPADHFEGRLTGTMLDGPDRGALVEARYAIQVHPEGSRRRKLEMTLDGWRIVGCLAAPGGGEEPEPEPPEPPMAFV